MRIAVMGSGSWGTAFGMVLADAGNEVTLWSRPRPVARLADPAGWTPQTLADRLPGAFAATFTRADEMAGDVL